MSNEFSGTGNAGGDPFLRQVTVGTKQHTIAVLRVFFPDYSPAANGSFEQTGGFWLDVNVWGEHRATEGRRHVKKGARVHVSGRLSEAKWIVTATGEERRALYLDADKLFLGLSRVAQVDYKPRRPDLRSQT